MRIIRFIIYLVVLSCWVPVVSSSQNIKHPNVAGQFYPADADQLSKMIDQFLSQADVKIYDHRVPVVIAPHAGYIYSGPTAAYSFKAISRQNPSIVIILAPSHHFPLKGFSIWTDGGFETPLGQVQVDGEFAQQLIANCSSCIFDPAVFEKEHSLEAEIPFIQKVFPQARIVPVIVGQPSQQALEQFASSLGRLMAGREDIQIVVSSDWSHYHDEVTAWKMDEKGISLVKALDVDQLWQNAQEGLTELCGIYPVMAVMILAKQQGWTRVDVLKTGNSAAATGDNKRVVGYAAMAFYADEASNNSSRLSIDDKRRLCEIAETTVRKFIQDKTIPDVQSSTESLNQPLGVFVTLKKNEMLRGCIGRIVADQPLYQSVRDMTVAAASQDPRFPPVQSEELKDIEIEISVLSKPKDVKNADEIQMGRDGVIISQGTRQGVFLPQVADETGWSRDQFLSELCSQKAGLPTDCWRDPRTRVKVFTADVFGKNDLK